MLSAVWTLVKRQAQAPTKEEAEEYEDLNVDDDGSDDDELNEISEQLLQERTVLKRRNANLKGRLRQVEQMLNERPPIWIADAERKQCFACQADFSIFNRRHHCRGCGEIFDARCTSKSKLLSYYPGAGPQRVCDACYEGKANFSFEDLDCSALVALGFGGLATTEDSFAFESIESPVVRARKERSQLKRRMIRNTSKCVHFESVESASAVVPPVHRGPTGRIRSEIPPAPPFPKELPKVPAGIAPISLLKGGAAKKTKPAFVPPPNAVKRIDFDELQKGISRLKKAPQTPAKKQESKTDAITELRSSLRRRRRSLEDSIIINGSPTEAAATTSIKSEPEATVSNECDSENVPVNIVLEKQSPTKKPALIGLTTTTVTGPGASLMDGLRETVAFRNVSLVDANSSWLE